MSSPGLLLCLRSSLGVADPIDGKRVQHREKQIARLDEVGMQDAAGWHRAVAVKEVGDVALH
eukprot:scaffold4944_cov209-Pinguiococcus_pyrenoidosus.AAC.6